MGLILILTAVFASLVFYGPSAAGAEDWYKPYRPPCTERQNVFEFTRKPAVTLVGKDKYEISFAVKGFCDVTVGLVDEKGKIVRHLASGVLGSNAPAPFQKDSLEQKIIWNGKDDLETYVKEPEKLKVKVSLGLKPVFDKLLGSTDPRNIPGAVVGIAVAEDGVYVLARGVNGVSSHAHAYLRKFDHDGNYIQSLVPPPADLPWKRLTGMGWVEYEPGKKSLQAPIAWSSLRGNGKNFLPGAGGGGLIDCQPVVVGDRFYYTNAGGIGYFGASGDPSTLHYVYTDGGTDLAGLKGRPMYWVRRVCHTTPRMAASPDGKYVYWIGLKEHGKYHEPMVLRCPLEGDARAEVFVGKAIGSKNKPRFEQGSSNDHLNNPLGIDCDAQGRVYVADNLNQRVQVFSPEGKYLKTIKIVRPLLLRVHRKTGAIYVLHLGRTKGRSTVRLTKLSSFDDPREELHVDGFPRGQLALDSWSAKPRFWVGGHVREDLYATSMDSLYGVPGENVSIWEEDGKTIRKIVDFDKEARKSDGDRYTGRWGTDGKAGVKDMVACDPTREQVYLRFFRQDAMVFDIRTGLRLKALDGKGTAKVRFPTPIDDMAFDKRGYMHCHVNVTPTMSGVGRLDPGQKSPYVDHLGRKHPDRIVYREVPYDYGEELRMVRKQTANYDKKPRWEGGIATKDQPGGKYFSDGMGVNMGGDIAENANIYFIPKMDDETFQATFAGTIATREDKKAVAGMYKKYMRELRERELEGEKIASIRRGPGLPLAGATVWTFDRTGELRKKFAAIAPFVLAGTSMDEDGLLYFSNSASRLIGDKTFLAGRGGTIGSDKPVRYRRIQVSNDKPNTGSYVKTKGTGVAFLSEKAHVEMTEQPDRPPELFYEPKGGQRIWVRGAEWVYAGASPITPGWCCSCPSLRAHLDWYKRSFVPESYRHSIGVLDTNGNLIMHIGTYGNHDSARGSKSRAPVGGDGIGMTIPRYVSGTDNYLLFDDWGERLVSLRLEYHTEEAAAVVVP
jgi:hypothetical protein